MSAVQENLRALLGAHPLFRALSPAALEQVVARSSEIHLGDEEVLYASGAQADQVFVLLSGALQIEYPLGGSARGKVTAVLLAPGFLGECQVVNGRAWSGTGVAVTDLVALGIKKDRFLALTREHPPLTQALYFELTARFLYAIETWRHEPAHKPDQQVARYLLARREVLAQLGARAELITIRQVDLARATGIRPETVNRILAKWTKSRWVKKVEQGLLLEDLPALTAVERSAPSPPLIQRCTVPSP